MRIQQMLLFLAIYSLLNGCSHRLYWLEITADKQVIEGYDEDQALRNHVAKLAKGPTVRGTDCTWFIVSAPVIVEKTRRGAYADAIEKAGPPYDALIDVLQTSTSYPPLPLYCVSLEGTAVQNETQYATIQSSQSSAWEAKPMKRDRGTKMSRPSGLK